MINSDENRDVHSQTQRQYYVNLLFEKAKVLDEPKRLKLITSFIEKCSIPDFLYMRKGLLDEHFQGSKIQRLIDQKLIDKVKFEFEDEVFFNVFPQHEVRAIFGLWKELDKDDLNSYLKSHINGTNVKTFIDSFPTIWSGPSGSYLDDFNQENYDFLKKLIDPKLIAKIISKEYKKSLELPEYNDSELWRMGEEKKELTLIAQFLHLHKANLRREETNKSIDEILNDESLDTLKIKSINKDYKGVILSDEVKYIVNPDYYSLVQEWKLGDEISTKKNDYNGDKLSYTLINANRETKILATKIDNPAQD